MARARYRLDIMGVILWKRLQTGSEKSSLYCMRFAKSSHLDLSDRHDQSRKFGCSGQKVGLQHDMEVSLLLLANRHPLTCNKFHFLALVKWTCWYPSDKQAIWNHIAAKRAARKL